MNYDSEEWKTAAVIQDFFRAGGNPAPVTPTSCKFLHTAEKLFVLFENREENSHHIVTEENMRSIVEEIVREKILLNTKEEIPHSVAIKVDRYEEAPEIDRIYANIFCETKSQKGILIGKGGSLLKKIGTEARLDLENIVEKKVFLALQVKVEKDWRKNDKVLKNLGYVSE